jgi:chemotaxis family two-component system response regulator PixG
MFCEPLSHGDDVVMAVKEIPPVTPLSLFTASKQIQFLTTLKRIRFSGKLVLSEPEGQQWQFFLHLGRIMYATGGTHPVRRWQRNLALYCPQSPTLRLTLERDLAKIDTSSVPLCWQYQLLSLWTQQQKITAQQAAHIIHAAIAEVLFDVAQARRATYQIQAYNSFSTPLALIDVEQVIAEVEEQWQVWRNDRVADYSPNLAPYHQATRTTPETHITVNLPKPDSAIRRKTYSPRLSGAPKTGCVATHPFLFPLHSIGVDGIG